MLTINNQTDIHTTLDQLVAQYPTETLHVMMDAFECYLEGQGNGLFRLFMNEETRGMASDLAKIAKEMPSVSQRRLVKLADETVLKEYRFKLENEDL